MKRTPSIAPNFTSSLLAWYGANAREMPWRVPPGSKGREGPDPYAVLVSEIMLQQTTVKAVVPFYQKWMKRFPTVGDLASADDESVLRQWEGLGYYSRARNLHDAAREISSQYAGTIPMDPERLRSLPGVGEYTAGAVASIAYGVPAPALDANSFRVWARLLATSDRKKVTAVFARVIPHDGPGDFNQALMDLGASVCAPGNPGCHSCPLAAWCRAFKSGEVRRYPSRKIPVRAVSLEASLGILFQREKVLVQRRGDKGLFPGMWEFPGGKILSAQGTGRRAQEKPEGGRGEKRGRGGKPLAETPEKAVVREIQEETGLKVRVGQKLGVFRHSYTRFSVALHVFFCARESGNLRRGKNLKWVRLDELEHLPMPAANRRIVEVLKSKSVTR